MLIQSLRGKVLKFKETLPVQPGITEIQDTVTSFNLIIQDLGHEITTFLCRQERFSKCCFYFRVKVRVKVTVRVKVRVMIRVMGRVKVRVKVRVRVMVRTRN